MLTIREIEQIIIDNKSSLERDFGLKKIGIFGSYIKSNQTDKSDIDIIVELSQPMGFVKFIKLENHLSDLLNAKVDLVTPKALKPFIGKRILEEVQYVG
jgi:uncharacterized protein